MNPFRKKSDREIVNALRRTERFRRPVGLALIVLGPALAGLAVWGATWIEHKVLGIAGALSESHRPIPAELRDVTALLAYTMGLRSGLLLTQGGFLGALFFALGVRLRFGGRKDRLLIRHFDLVNARVSPNA
jgi:hypothetical protein